MDSFYTKYFLIVATTTTTNSLSSPFSPHSVIQSCSPRISRFKATYLLKLETVARGGDLLNFSIEFLGIPLILRPKVYVYSVYCKGGVECVYDVGKVHWDTSLFEGCKAFTYEKLCFHF